MNRNTIIHLIHNYSKPGGIEVILPKIISNIEEYTFRVFLTRPISSTAPSVYEGLEISISTGSKNNIFAAGKLLMYCLKNRRDIFHLFNAGPILLLVCKICKPRKIIYSIHGTVYWKKNYKRIIIRAIWKIALSKSHILTSNSNFSKRVFQEKISNKYEIEILYNPISIKGLESIEFKRKVSNKSITLIYVGRLEPGKGLQNWIDLANGIHHLNPNTRFEIWGIGSMFEELQSIISRNGYSNFIELCGFSSNIDVVYNSSDLMLFLSEYESFGNVVVESILHGTPVLTYPIPSMCEIFQNNHDFLIPFEADAQYLADKIKDLDVLKNKTNLLAQEFRKRFSIESHILHLKYLYS